MSFFGESGLTSTSANHIANLAKEYYQSQEIYFNNLTFYDIQVSTLNGNKETLSYGESNLSDIPNKLDKIAKAKSLIAWLREALKEKDRLLEELSNITLDDYCKLNNLECPTYPESPVFISEKDYLNSLSAPERLRYFTLEAKAANIGKYIHQLGKYSAAREQLKKKIQNPKEFNSDNLIVTSYIPSVKIEDIDAQFFELQKEYREAQAELNSIKYKMETYIKEEKLKAHIEFKRKCDEYSIKYKILANEYDSYILKEQKKIGNLKIIIPDNLKDIYNEINSLGKCSFSK